MDSQTQQQVPHTVDFKQEVLDDYFLACLSRELSILGRKEVLTGKAKFGILGDGKELPQIAMAKAFKKGDWRSGYYRDQTFALAIGECTVEQFFAQLYADAERDPWSGGRQMNNHFATPTIDKAGNWLSHKDLKNISSDISPTAGQMARALGLALASRKYRDVPGLQGENRFSDGGNEVVFCTIGDASTSEGAFWEVMNAAAVEHVPLVTLVWDDGYGISVPTELQTVKGSISQALAGFATEQPSDNGIYIETVKAWDYPDLVATISRVVEMVRQEHRPALIHVQEVTQPQGHSTSGSHQRYKSKERLAWEEAFDGIKKLEEFIKLNGLSDDETLADLRAQAKEQAKVGKQAAWSALSADVKATIDDLKAIFTACDVPSAIASQLSGLLNPTFHEVVQIADRAKIHYVASRQPVPPAIATFIDEAYATADERYHTHLVSETSMSAMMTPIVHPTYDDDAASLNGYQILNQFFDYQFSTRPELIAFGEDVGQIGDVNQGFAGLQDKYGSERVFDTGIREWSIMGTAIGTAMRGLRPIAEIQYLDYLIYGLSPLSDDLATLRYRTDGMQAAPAIIRTRGHRLEGVWHAGSPLGLIVNSLNGMHVCVPRNMVQAAGMYNTLLQSDDPAIVIECLNGYRLKERVPNNLGQYAVPLGVPDVLQKGSDLTIVTYGSCVRECVKAIAYLEEAGYSISLIDVQTLLPFDLEGVIIDDLATTSRVLFVDEDVPSGGTAYMLKQVLVDQGGYTLLDAQPGVLSAAAHRTPFGSDGDYFTKPNGETIFYAALKVLEE
jgi:pyruvate/2-oxoglutarate/acetoin dehydrogenase E1 component/TPP-dependent pyruvate/acetoin dehydrogenase alpha subunit